MKKTKQTKQIKQIKQIKKELNQIENNIDLLHENSMVIAMFLGFFIIVLLVVICFKL